MGLRIVNHALSAAGERPNTHLCEVTPNRYRRDFAAQIPSSISGEEFLAWLGETGDPATRIDPDERYSVRAATEHAIYENHRVCRFVEQIATAAIARSHTARVLPLLRAGELMYASHWSYSRIRLGSRETNVLVRIAREMGTAGGLYGARVTAAGLGGTMAVLTSGGDAARQCIRELSSRYADATGLTPRILEGGASCGARLISARIPSAPGSAGG